MKSFVFSILGPEQDHFHGDLLAVSFHAEDGAMQIKAHHASITGSILFSRVRLQDAESHEEVYVIRDGIFLFDQKTNSGRILALSIEKESEMDLSSIEEYLAFLEHELGKGTDLSEYQVKYLNGEKLAVEHQLKKMQTKV